MNEYLILFQFEIDSQKFFPFFPIHIHIIVSFHIRNFYLAIISSSVLNIEIINTKKLEKKYKIDSGCH